MLHPRMLDNTFRFRPTLLPRSNGQIRRSRDPICARGGHRFIMRTRAIEACPAQRRGIGRYLVFRKFQRASSRLLAELDCYNTCGG